VQSKIEKLNADVRQKLDTAEQRLKKFNTDMKAAGSKAAGDARSMIASLNAKAEQQKADIQNARTKVKDWAQHTKEVTAEKIAEWKGKKEMSKLESRAKDADDYADSAIMLASAAVDDAERAIAEAILARADLDGAKTASTGARA
jgi:hypothetical protein